MIIIIIHNNNNNNNINNNNNNNNNTSVEIEEIQRGLSIQAGHTESSKHEQPTSNQPDVTPIEEIPQQQHTLNPRQMALNSRLIAQLQQKHRLRLPALKNTYRTHSVYSLYTASHWCYS